jgi:hypothetical protein
MQGDQIRVLGTTVRTYVGATSIAIGAMVKGE